MSQSAISDLKSKIGGGVTVKGWLYNKRSKGKIHFLLVRDGTGVVQCVATANDIGKEAFELCNKISQESSIVVTGVAREDKRSPGGVELTMKDIKLVAMAEEYPIQIQDTTPDVGFLMERRHLWLRSRKQAATLKIRAEVIKAIRGYLDGEGFVCVDSPILTGSACEGTTNLFELNYFDDKAFLTQSGQLYQEAACMALGKTYCLGPVFRAEKSKTRKHLTEFWMLEPEVAYMKFDGLLELIEKLVSHIVARVLENRKEELKVLERNTASLEKVSPPFPKITYDKAVKIINDAGVGFKWGEDFGAPHEEAVSANFDKPVMIHHYPSTIKPFYMQPSEDGKFALCVDVIAPEGYGEIVGGSQRLHDLATLEKRIAEHKLPKEAFEWYVDLRRYGTVPHSGFGLGIERTVAWLAGTEHVRECIPFPRMLYKIYP